MVGYLEMWMESLWVWEKLWEAKRLAVQQELDRQLCDEDGKPVLLCSARSIPDKCRELISSLQEETQSIMGALALLNEAQQETPIDQPPVTDSAGLRTVQRATAALREVRASAIQQRVTSPRKNTRPLTRASASPGASPGAARLQSTVNLLHSTRSRLDNTQCLIASPEDSSRLLTKRR
eukprot:GFYU01009494.1.p1 GENE.GFYU01009494.1~~GFYU01009494.1.p1  ORF type:complete len:179 (-),score=3.56 GFYU01009494.1:58-594(-)